MSVKQLDKLFNPESIAVVGDFNRATCKAHTLIKNLTEYHFNGNIFAISTSNKSLPLPDNVTILPYLELIPIHIDILFFTVSIKEIYSILKKSNNLNNISNIVIASGIETKEDEQLLLNLKKNFRILGAHSIGLIIPHLNINASFYTKMPNSGGIALISQSGAIMSSILDLATLNNIGFKYAINIGTILDIDFGDIIDYLWGENDVKAIILYVEKIKHIRNFLSAARHTSRIKPILAVKSGNNTHSKEIIIHRIHDNVGDFDVYDNAFRRAGIIRVDDIDELILAGNILSRSSIPEDDNLCIITNSGGAGILALDELKNRKIKLKKLDKASHNLIKTSVEDSEYTENPIDISGAADEAKYIKCAEICFQHTQYNSYMFIIVVNGFVEPAYVIKEIEKKNIYKKQLIFVILGGDEYYLNKLPRMESANISIFFSLKEAIDSYFYGVSYRYKLKKLLATPPRFNKNFNFNLKKAKKIVRNQTTELNFFQAKELLKSYDIPVLESYETKDINDVFYKAEHLGYPINLIIFSDSFKLKESRKIDNPKALKKSYQEIIDFKLNVDKIYVEKHITNVDIVLNIGVKTDVEVGPYIYLGLGGKYKRIISKISIMLPPLNRFLASRLIERSDLKDFLVNLNLIDKLEELLVKLSYLISDFSEIKEINIDPLVNYSNNFYALNFEIKLRKTNITAPYHFVILPYPNNYEFNEKLPDGTPVFIRPIKPEDEKMHIEFFYSLSRETNYFRFFSYRKKLTHEQLASFTQIDYNREVAIVAIVNENGKDKIIGVNRLVYYPNEEKYEFAIVVADAYQTKGVGKILMEKLFFIAKDRNIREIYGSVLAQNGKMLRFSKKFGFEVVGSDGEIVYIKKLLIRSDKLD